MNNREIKFRAWDTIHNCWFPGNWKVFSEESFNDLNGQIIFQEFTGLLDKNGKEIYESDIVKAVAKSDYPEDSKTSVIIWRQRDCSFELEDDASLPLNWYENLEIIGNIYESREK